MPMWFAGAFVLILLSLVAMEIENRSLGRDEVMLVEARSSVSR